MQTMNKFQLFTCPSISLCQSIITMHMPMMTVIETNEQLTPQPTCMKPVPYFSSTLIMTIFLFTQKHLTPNLFLPLYPTWMPSTTSWVNFFSCPAHLLHAPPTKRKHLCRSQVPATTETTNIMMTTTTMPATIMTVATLTMTTRTATTMQALTTTATLTNMIKPTM